LVKKPYATAHDIYLGQGDGDWQDASRYQVWTKSYPLDAPPLSVLERRAGTVLRVPDTSRLLHHVPAGTPYHIEHLFGFWRTTGSDTMFLRAEYDNQTYYTMIVGTHALEFGTETIAWYCPRCVAEVRAATFDLRRYGLDAFAAFVLEQVRAFNASSDTRTCPSCVHVHPYAYGLNENADAGPESQGRAAW
jgi:hypothetical protein